MEGVYKYSKAEGIPYKHILLDSWWYTNGDGDGLKEWDASLIKMACRSDGRLLHPAAAARAIDASFALAGAGPQPKQRNVHAVMATHTIVDGSASKWSHVLTIALAESFKLLPKHLGDDFGSVDSSTAGSSNQQRHRRRNCNTRKVCGVDRVPTFGFCWPARGERNAARLFLRCCTTRAACLRIL